MKTIALMLLAPGLFAQANLSLFVGEYVDRGMGFRTPAPLVGASGQVVAKQIRVAAWFWASSANKHLTQDGWTSWGDAAVLRRIPLGLEAGPALLVRHTSTSGWEKTSVYPSLGLEKVFNWKNERWRAGLRIHFRDQWTQNNGRGATVSLETDSPRGANVKVSWTAMAFTILPGDTSPYASAITVTFGYRWSATR